MGIFKWKIVIFSNVRIGDIAKSIDKDGYITIGINGRHNRAHRLAWLYVYGNLPEHEIDYINHNKIDNRIKNLRDVTRFENAKNKSMRSSSKSGIQGVSWDKKRKKWIAQIMKKNLGRFNSIDEAKQAREEAKIKYGFHPNHA